MTPPSSLRNFLTALRSGIFATGLACSPVVLASSSMARGHETGNGNGVRLGNNDEVEGSTQVDFPMAGFETGVDSAGPRLQERHHDTLEKPTETGSPWNQD